MQTTRSNVNLIEAITTDDSVWEIANMYYNAESESDYKSSEGNIARTTLQIEPNIRD